MGSKIYMIYPGPYADALALICWFTQKGTFPRTALRYDERAEMATSSSSPHTEFGCRNLVFGGPGSSVADLGPYSL